MKRLLVLYCPLVLLVILSSCTTVTVNKPMGVTPLKLDADEWDGNWVEIHDGEWIDISKPDEIDGLPLKVMDAHEGILQLTVTEKNREQMVEIFLRRSGKWTFVSLKSEDEGDEEGYLWGRMKKEKNLIIIWLPDPEEFAALVKDGILPGEVGESGDVSLEDLDKGHYEMFSTEEHGPLFVWDEPMIYYRLTE